MERRFVQGAVILCWLLSSWWLVTAKLWPLAFSRQPPQYELVGAGTDRQPSRIRWRIELGKQPLGTATMQIDRPSMGSPLVNSDISLRHLPVGRILDQLSGMWSMLARSVGLTDSQFEISLHINTRMHFDVFGELLFFQSTVDVDEMKELLRIRGTMTGDSKLQLCVSAGSGMPRSSGQQDADLIKQTIPMSREALIIDAFAPHPYLANLRVGQEWVMQSLQPFAPGSPLQTTRARVLRQELLPWDREMESMFVVQLDRVEPQGLTTTQRSRGRLWVRSDGSVVRQTVEMGGLQLNFIRIPDDAIDYNYESSKTGPVDD